MKTLKLLNSIELEDIQKIEKAISAKGSDLSLRLMRHLRKAKFFEEKKAIKAVYGSKPASSKTFQKLASNLNREIENYCAQKTFLLSIEKQPAAMHLHSARTYAHLKIEDLFFSEVEEGLESTADRAEYEAQFKLLMEHAEFLIKTKSNAEPDTCNEIVHAMNLAEITLKCDFVRKYSELQKFRAYNEYILKHQFPETILTPIRDTWQIDMKISGDDYSSFLNAYVRGCHEIGKKAVDCFEEADKYLDKGKKIIPGYADLKFKMLQNIAINYDYAGDYNKADENFEKSWAFAKENNLKVPILPRLNYLRWLITKMKFSTNDKGKRAAIKFYNDNKSEFNTGNVVIQARVLYIVATSHLHLSEPNEALNLLLIINKKDVSATVKLYYHWLKIIALFDLDRIIMMKAEGKRLKYCWESIVELGKADSDLNLKEISDVFYNFSIALSDIELSSDMINEISNRIERLLNVQDPTQRIMLPLNLLKERLEQIKRKSERRAKALEPGTRTKWHILRQLPVAKEAELSKNSSGIRLRILQLIQKIHKQMSAR